jgi:hypothetical protein
VVRLAEIGHVGRLIYADPHLSEYEGDGFVAIHCDGSVNPSARGASVGYRTVEGQRFGHAWMRHYQAHGWTGGFRRDNYTPGLSGYYGHGRAVARGNRHAFIAEAGFLTSPLDRALLANPEGHDRFARAVAAAVAEIWGGRTPSRPEPRPEPTPEPEPPTILEEDEVLLIIYSGHTHLLVGGRLVHLATQVDIDRIRWGTAQAGKPVPEWEVSKDQWRRIVASFGRPMMETPPDDYPYRDGWLT